MGEKTEERKLFRRLNVEITAEAVIAGCALVLSLITGVAQIFLAVRGPVINVRPLDRVVFYRDGVDNDHAVLEMALRTTMVNSAASDFGDLLDRAEITIRTRGAPPVAFPYESLVKVHLVKDSAAAVDRCEVDAQCIALPSLVVVDHGDRLVDLPGGKARSDYMTFGLTQAACGAVRNCRSYATFATAAHLFDQQPIIMHLKLTFHRAGVRILECRTEPLDGGRLEHIGWLSLSCAGGRAG
jgi:hypothetical protein